MFKNILFTVCFVVSLLSFSQNKDYHIIELLPIEDDTISSVDFYVSKVIDNRVYKDNIGVAQKGMFNKKVLSKFNKPFEDALMEYLNIICPVDNTKQGLVLRINQLLISENTGAFKETGKTIVDMDVLVNRNGAYFLLGSFSAFAEKNSVDVTRKHDDRIRSVISDCLMQFNQSDWKDREGRAFVTEMPNEPILLNEALKKGFFISFLELYRNEPFEDASIEFKESDHSTVDKLYLKEREHKRALYYAYSDGNNIYINASNYSGEKYFVKTEFIDKYLLFNDTFVNQNEVAGMSLAFGVLGILASNIRSNVLLNMDTGQYHIIDDNKIRLLLKKDYPDLYEKMIKYPNNLMLLKSILLGLLNGDDSHKVREILEAI